MKKIIYLLVLAAAAISCSQSQTKNTTADSVVIDTSAAARENSEKPKVDTNYIGKAGETNPSIMYIPAFEMVTVNGQKFTQADIKPNKPLMLVYFSPDCNHCTDFIAKLKPHLKELANVQIVLASWVKMQAVQQFYMQAGLGDYKNIIVGTEGNQNLQIQQYFQVKETPYIALYNRQGRLAWYYEKPPRADHVIAKAKSL
ncbi:MAG: redoxin domain-containing protein [Sphingobacteriales bacterium]|nr:MAG: redoxin domain-containing protein [Sphingobacteriales bacterium]